MKKLLIFVVILYSAIFYSCSEEDTNNSVTPDPSNGEILLATVPGDSVGTNNPGGPAISIYAHTVSFSTLNFTDRDSASVSFIQVKNNTISSPINIFYLNGSDSVFLQRKRINSCYFLEQFIDVSMASPFGKCIFHILNYYFK
ncbi:MAG: hypothetical protein R3A12_07550 [Ignavibacteria bacterium]